MRRHTRPLRARPRLEMLEDRLAPALFTVNSLANSGAGSLRDAITAVNADPGADTIDFSVTGTIQLTSALPAITGTLEITGPGAANLTVRRIVTTPNFAIFTAAAGSDVSVSGLTVANGSLGGVSVSDADLTLTNCVITGNISSGNTTGGGVHFVGTTAHTLAVVDCTFSGNNGSGTSIRFAAGAASHLDISNSTFTNPGGLAGGAAVHAVQIINGTATVTSSAFTNNRGGLSATDADVTVEGCTFTANAAGTTYGGGVYVTATANGHHATMRNSSFVDNTALTINGSGGGVAGLYVSLTLEGCTFDHNSGGAALFFDGNATNGNVLNMSGCTWRNHATTAIIAQASAQGTGTNVLDLTMTDCVLENNSGRSFLSGSTNSSVVMTRTRFANNQMGIGPGMWIALTGTGTSISVVDCVFENNSNNDNGAALGITAVTAAISGSTFIGNVSTGDSVGGVAASVTNLDITNCVFVGNASLSSGGGAGGLSVRNAVSLHIADSTFADNYSRGDGGGLLVFGFPNTLIERSTFARNFAARWGGAALITGGTVINCTFSGNSTNEVRGGLYAQGSGTILNSTFSGNRADADGAGLATGNMGGGLWASTSWVLHNNIIAGNYCGSASLPDDLVGGAPSSTNNLVGAKVTSTQLANGVNGNIVGTLANPINPRLGDLDSNGGPTQTHALLPDSPALDAGNDSVVTYATDQRGAARIADGPDPDGIAHVDMGAFESGVSLQTIPDQMMNEDGTLTISFQVGDASIPGLIVTASADNPILLPGDAAHLDVTGTGSTRTLTINPALNEWGDTIITVTAERDGEVVTTSFHLVVVPVNDVPLAANDAYTTPEDTPLAASSVLDNDDDYHNGAPGEYNIPLGAQLVAGPTHAASFAIVGDGTFTYTPAADFNGVDIFTYRAVDTLGGLSNIAFVMITVTPVNDAPVAMDDAYAIDEDVELIVAAVGVLENDADLDGEMLYSEVVSDPVHGILSLSPNGAFSYMPAENFNGVDSFTYRTFDGELYSDAVTVMLTIGPLNDTPTADDQAAATDEDTSLGLTLTGDDGDPELTQMLTFSLMDAPAHGTITSFDLETGAVTYMPEANYFGDDSFTFAVSDGELTSAPATITITVNPVEDNTAPAISLDNVGGIGDPIFENDAFSLAGFVIDQDAGDAHTVVIYWGPDEGSDTINLGAGELSFNASHQYLDDDPTGSVADIYDIVVTVTDSEGASGAASASVTVYNVAPAINGAITGPANAVPSQPLSFTVGGFSDIGTLDTHTTSWQVLNSSSMVVAGGSDSVLNVILSVPDVYTVLYSVADDDLGSDVESLTVTVSYANVQTCVCCNDEPALVIGNLGVDDRIHVSPNGNDGGLQITLTNRLSGTVAYQSTFAPPSSGFDQIVIYGSAAADHITIADSISVDAVIRAGAGDDKIRGGSGNDIILGEAGDDMLLGGNGRDLMIGGLGADRMVGDPEDDILIAGYTAFDNNAEALCAIMAEWKSASSFADRVAHLSNNDNTDGLNGLFELIGADGANQTVFDDGAADILTGSAGSDWFLYNFADGGALDRVTDLSTFEALFASELDF